MSEPEEYRVLARKYRPQHFDELIGQDALVRTLTNAIEMDRIAHAFMLTGVRGVGKTTTARIIAKALNYSKGPTTGSTDDCPICQAISEDRHPDVIEMDAASRTGIDDIREILDGVRYAPTEARFKVYIIDEVHMLSKQAFNALLKTLEEPPAHVKFIFATTEIRKVPITVLSRCQRFDLRRVDVPTLAAHFISISNKEGVKAEEEAIALIARAADGSVRDGLSLLDQAIAIGGEALDVKIVQEMIGLADRAKNIDILERVLTGNIAEALEIMDDLYKAGNDPLMMLQDLLELAHVLTRFKAIPGSNGAVQTMGQDQLDRLQQMASEFSMPTLGKTWQILLKGIGEVQIAPNAQQAAEIILIRLAYAADLPDPKDLIRKLDEQGGVKSSNVSAGAGVSGGAAPVSGNTPVHAQSGGGAGGSALPAQGVSAAAGPQGHLNEVSSAVQGNSVESAAAVAHGAPDQAGAVLQAVPQSETVLDEPFEIRSLRDIVDRLEATQEFILSSQVSHYVHLVKLEPGRMEFRPGEHAPSRLAQDLGQKLSALMGQRFIVSVSNEAGAPSLAEEDEALKRADREAVLNMPIVRDFLKVFPDAKLTDISDE